MAGYKFYFCYVRGKRQQNQISFFFSFCFIDFYQPFKEDELEQSTEVQIMFPSEPPVSLFACNEVAVYVKRLGRGSLFWVFFNS